MHSARLSAPTLFHFQIRDHEQSIIEFRVHHNAFGLVDRVETPNLDACSVAGSHSAAAVREGDPLLHSGFGVLVWRNWWTF